MPKRFIDTSIFSSPSVRKLPGKLKLFWVYLFTNCDHAGIWVKDFEAASLFCGMGISEDEATKYLDGKIISIDNNARWFIPGFIRFQYPSGLNQQNKAHRSVLAILKEYGIGSSLAPTVAPTVAPTKGHYVGAKDKDKDKDLDKDMVNDLEIKVKEIMEYFKKTTRREYNDEDTSLVIENLSNGKTYEQHMHIINVKIHDDYFKNNPQFMDPQTLFGKNFGKYTKQRIEDFQRKPKPLAEEMPEDYYTQFEVKED